MVDSEGRHIQLLVEAKAQLGLDESEATIVPTDESSEGNSRTIRE